MRSVVAEIWTNLTSTKTMWHNSCVMPGSLEQNSILAVWVAETLMQAKLAKIGVQGQGLATRNIFHDIHKSAIFGKCAIYRSNDSTSADY